MSAMRSFFRQISRKFKPPVGTAASIFHGKIRKWDGATYRYGIAGNLIRVSPLKPWRGKSERRRVIKERRAYAV